MNRRTMIAALATATTGVALLAAPSHAQMTDLNASAATAPKARSDTAHPASAAKRKPDSSTAPSTHVIGSLSLLKIQFGAIEGRGQAAFRLADLMRLDAHSDDAGRRPPGRQ